VGAGSPFVVGKVGKVSKAGQLPSVTLGFFWLRYRVLFWTAASGTGYVCGYSWMFANDSARFQSRRIF